MQLPGFLRRYPSEAPELPEGGATSGHATRGGIIGCFAALVFWFIPIPVAAIVWAFDLQGPFGDHMLTAVPFYLALPILGAGIADLLGRRHRPKA